MTSFTAAYLLRLAMWGIVFGAFLGGPVWMAWRLRHRTLRRAGADARHRSAARHLLALLILPMAMIVGVHLTLSAMGAEIFRGPPRAQTLSEDYGPHVGSLALMTVGVWLVGVFLSAIRLAADAWQLRRLRLGTAPATLADEVQLLGKDLLGGQRLTVRVADVPVPQVMGLARPVLVVPPSLDGLPAAERQAVLLHELAHVARRDFSTNLRQRLVLVTLWFQPAAWALYRHFCREREACCDRLAVCHGASATALARALVRLAENRRSPPIAMAIADRGDLGWRVNLLLKPEAMGLTPPRRWQAWVLGPLALVLSGLGGARLTVADGAVSDLYIASTLGPVVAVRARDPAGSFGLRILRGRVIEATVEGQRLSQASIRQRGGHVTLLDAAREPVVSFRVTPHGRIEWRARTAGMPRG